MAYRVLSSLKGDSNEAPPSTRRDHGLSSTSNRGHEAKARRLIDSHIITHRATEGKKISAKSDQRLAGKTYSFRRAGLTGAGPDQPLRPTARVSPSLLLLGNLSQYLRLPPNSPQGRSMRRTRLLRKPSGARK